MHRAYRSVHVIGPGFDISPYVVQMLDVWTLPIRLDPKWNNGDYYGRDEPLAGVAEALKIVTITARAPGWADKTFGYGIPLFPGLELALQVIAASNFEARAADSLVRYDFYAARRRRAAVRWAW